MNSTPTTASPTKTAESEPAKKSPPPPFKLCFPIRGEIGRSGGGNYPTTVSTIAPKFYSRAYASFRCADKKLQQQINKLKFVGPREKYKMPITESQRYGWYQIRMNTPDKDDRRINFKKNTHQLIKEHLMNYEKIRE